MSDKIGKRTPIVLGIFVSIIGSLVCAFSTSIYILISGLMLWGLGASLGSFFGIEVSAIFAGIPIGAFIADSLGYISVFYVVVPFMGVALFIAFMWKGLKQLGSQRPEGSMYIAVKEIQRIKAFGDLSPMLGKLVENIRRARHCFCNSSNLLI